MSIPTGDITNHSLLWYNPNDGRVVHSNAGTTGRFGGAALDTEDLPTAVSALRRSSTYNPPVFGEGLDTTIVAEHSTVVGSQDTPVMSIPDYVTAVGNCSLRGKLDIHATIVGTRESSGTCGICSIGIGYVAGSIMGNRCVSVGNGTMLSNSAMTGPDYTVAIGDFAAGYNAGAESVYLGAGAGLAGGNFNNVICIGRINPTQSDSLFVKPVRKVDGSGAGPVPEPLHYIEATGEIVHVPPRIANFASKYVDHPLLSAPITRGDWVSFPEPCKVTVVIKNNPTRVMLNYRIMLNTHYTGDIKTTDARYEFVAALFLDGQIALQSQTRQVLWGYGLTIGVSIPSSTFSQMISPGTHEIELKIGCDNVVCDTALFSIYSFSAYCDASWDDT